MSWECKDVQSCPASPCFFPAAISEDSRTSNWLVSAELMKNISTIIYIGNLRPVRFQYFFKRRQWRATGYQIWPETWGSFHDYLRWTVVLVAPLFGIVAAACSNGRMGTHTTMVTGHILTLTQIAGNLLMARLQCLGPSCWEKSSVAVCSCIGTCRHQLMRWFFRQVGLWPHEAQCGQKAGEGMKDVKLLPLGKWSSFHRCPTILASSMSKLGVQVQWAILQGFLFYVLRSVCIPILELAAAQELIIKQVAVSPGREIAN